MSVRRHLVGLVVTIGLGLSVGCGGDDSSSPAGGGGGGGGGSDAGSQLPSALDASVDAAAPPVVVDDAGDAPPATSILPWKVGNTWTYKVTGDGEVTSKVITIGALEPVGGTGANKDRMANKVVTAKGTDDETISWQVEDQGGLRVVRLREQSFGAKTKLLQLDEFYDPYKLHIDGTPVHSVAGASWTETYMDQKDTPDAGSATTTEMDAWRVDAVDQSVTVPAGTFKSIVFIKGGGSNLKTYWYTVGVGKIKETGGQTEELVSYSIAP